MPLGRPTEWAERVTWAGEGKKGKRQLRGLEEKAERAGGGSGAGLQGNRIRADRERRRRRMQPRRRKRKEEKKDF